MAFVAANAVVCERALSEKDNAVSLIRCVDAFFVPTQSVSDPDKFPIGMTLYATVRVTNDDEGLHSLSFNLVRPDGESKLIPALENKQIPEGKFPGQHRSVMAVGQIGVVPKQMGQHYFALIFDGNEVARAYFTLLPVAEFVATGTPN